MLGGPPICVKVGRSSDSVYLLSLKRSFLETTWVRNYQLGVIMWDFSILYLVRSYLLLLQ